MIAYLIDDEPAASEVLEWALKKYCPTITSIKSFSDLSAAHVSITQQPPDVLFLDIDMPNLNGFEFLKSLGRVDFPVIFVTAHESYALTAIKVSALDYLLKPVDKDELIAAVDKVRTNKTSTNIHEFLVSLQKQEKIQIHHDGQISFVLPEEVVYLKADRSYTSIFLANGKELVVSKTLKDVESQFLQPEFIRVHHSYLINKQHVRAISKGGNSFLILSNEREIPISRAKKQDVLKLLGT
ncbi:MAG: LytTR family DNA-binding domain-containing protein [Saprospiraceae bacterium]|nr:LytTR family DNA-binding domain-containing protein [Saprospiraceae bacterium]